MVLVGGHLEGNHRGDVGGRLAHLVGDAPERPGQSETPTPDVPCPEAGSPSRARAAGCRRTELRSPSANATGFGVPRSDPLNHRPPAHLSAAHPVTAPYAGRRAPACTMRCSVDCSTDAGTHQPPPTRLHSPERVCHGDGPSGAPRRPGQTSPPAYPRVARGRRPRATHQGRTLQMTSRHRRQGHRRQLHLLHRLGECVGEAAPVDDCWPHLSTCAGVVRDASVVGHADSTTRSSLTTPAAQEVSR